MSRARRRGYAGLTKLRKTLKRLEPDVTSEVREVIRRGANSILHDAKQNARSVNYGKEPGIRDTGDMIDSMDIKFGRDGFTALIGPGAENVKGLKAVKEKRLKSGKLSKVTIRGKQARWDAFKGLWAEFGTKGDPSKNIPPVVPAPFMQPAYDANQGWIKKDLKKAINAALATAVRSTNE